MWRISRLIEKFRLGIIFFMRGFRSNSWDASEVYMDIATRLEQCLKSFESDKYYCWCDGDTGQIKKLKECIVLCNKLHRFEYSKHHLQLMEKYTTNRDDPFKMWELFPNAKVIDSNLYGVMMKKSCNRDRMDHDTDKARLIKLLSTGLEHWAT